MHMPEGWAENKLKNPVADVSQMVIDEMLAHGLSYRKFK